MHRSRIVVPLLAGTLLLASCGGATEPAPAADDRPAASEPAERSTSASAASPPETPAESPAQSPEAEKGDAGKTPAGPSAGKADADPSTGPSAGGRDAGATDDDGPTRDAAGSGSSDGGTEGLPGWPIESAPAHGGTFWAAYVAVGAPGDPALQQVLAEVQQLWPRAGLGELSCDEGAAAALGRSPTEHAVAVYFPTEQHITEFRRRWEAPFVGAVRVTTFCAD